MKTTFVFINAQKLGDGKNQSPDRKNLSDVRRRILEPMEGNDRISMSALAEKLGYSTTAIEKNVDFLKTNGYLERIGNTKSGHWRIN